MNRLYLIERLLLLTALIAAVALQIPPTEARGQYSSSRFSRRQRFSQAPPPPALDSDSELLRALEFLEKYERMKGTASKQAEEMQDIRVRALPPLYAGPSRGRDHEPYSINRAFNEIPSALELDNRIDIPYRPTKLEEEAGWRGRGAAAGADDLALEDFFPPRPEDLETNEVAFAEAIVDEFRESEGRRQRELFEKILGDVMAEKLLEQDEEDKIEELLEAQEEEEEGLDDLAAILETESSVSSSVPEAGVGLYNPEEVQMSMFSASSLPAGDEIFGGVATSSSSVDEGASEPGIEAGVDVEDSFVLSEAGLEALDEAEKILKEGYDDGSDELEEGGSNESVPDFDDTSESEAESSEVVKENVLKDVIYRIVENNLRRKLEESLDNGEQYPEETSIGSSIPEEGESSNYERPDLNNGGGKEDELLDTLVGEIRDQVNQLSEKIMRQIESRDADEEDDDDNDDDESANDSREQEDSIAEGARPEMVSSSSIADLDVGRPNIDASSSSIPGDIVGVDVDVSSSTSAVIGEFDDQLSSSSFAGEEEAARKDAELINAIHEIVPAAQTKVCPVLSYLVDDCSVIEGFKGLGSGGYREAFSRPCNRHQLCYICSNSYGIPPNLCDEIYKAELLTLCNGDPECKQRAKYFWIAATNDRMPPHFPLSFCSDSCLLDYLLDD